jgi:hypothetical protein
VDYWCNHIHFDTAASYYGGDQESELYTFWESTYYPNGKPTYHFYPYQHGPGGAQPPLSITSSTWARNYAFTNAPILGYYLLGGNSQVDPSGNIYPAQVVFVIDTAGNAAFRALRLTGISSGAATDSLLSDSAGTVRHMSVGRAMGGAAYDVNLTAISVNDTLTSSALMITRTVSASSGTVLITWNPGLQGQILNISKSDATSNYVGVKLIGGGTINGQSTLYITEQYSNRQIQYDTNTGNAIIL